jgi:hypothetical protein
MKQPEIKDLAFKFALGDEGDEKGTFTGHASIFDVVDSYGDVVAPGAFKRTLKHKKGEFPLLWSHDNSKPIGVISAEEDTKGLKVRGTLNLDVQLAREIRSLMKQGAVTGLSIGYQTVKEDVDKERNARVLKEINLWEISTVVFPACAPAQVEGVKAAGDLEDPPPPVLCDNCKALLEDSGKPAPPQDPPDKGTSEDIHVLDLLRIQI